MGAFNSADVQQCRKRKSVREWRKLMIFGGTVEQKFYFQHLITSAPLINRLRAIQQCLSTAVTKTNLLSNKAENYQLSALLNLFFFIFGTVVQLQYMK